MAEKVRRIDFLPDEYIAGVGNVLRADEQGVYWMICSLIYSEGRAIAENHRRIGGLCRLRPAVVKRIIDDLVDQHGKLVRTDGKLSQKRAESELERASKRIQTAHENGVKGGRPKKKTEENQQTLKADGFQDEKLTTNYQPPTINHQLEDSPHSPPEGDRSVEPEPPDRQPTVEEEFSTFWQAYPHKVGKGGQHGAASAFKKARRKASLAVILGGLERYKATKPPDRNWCNPATWLNQERWADQPDLVMQTNGHSHGNGKLSPAEALFLGAHLAVEERARRREEEARRQGEGGQDIGPAEPPLDIGGSPGG